MPASMSSRAADPSPSANAASLTTWQTIRPSTSPGASPTHAVCLPSVAKNRSAAAAAEVGAVGSARQLDEPRISASGGSAWKPTALPPGSSAASEPLRAADRLRARPAAARPAPRRRSGRESETGLPVGGLHRRSDLPAGGGRGLPELDRERRVAGDHDQPVAAARRPAARDPAGRCAAVRAVVVVATARLAPSAARRDRIAR